MTEIAGPLVARTTAGGRKARKARMFKCQNPKCGAPCFIRGVEDMSGTVVRVYVQCTNCGCSATARWQVAFEHFINPGVNNTSQLPICPPEQVPRFIITAKDPATDTQTDLFRPPPEAPDTIAA